MHLLHVQLELKHDSLAVRELLGRSGFHDRRPVLVQLWGQVRRRESLDPQLRGELGLEVVTCVGVASGHQDVAVWKNRGAGVVHPRNLCAFELLEPLASAAVWVVKDRDKVGLVGVLPRSRALLGTVENQELSGGQDQHVAHDTWRRHDLLLPLGAGLGDLDPGAVLQRREEVAFACRGVGVGFGAAADHDLSGDDLGVVDVELYWEESRHPAGRVVAGAALQGGELQDNLVLLKVKEDGSVVGEDEDVAVGGEVDERVEVVLVQVGGLV